MPISCFNLNVRIVVFWLVSWFNAAFIDSTHNITMSFKIVTITIKPKAIRLEFTPYLINIPDQSLSCLTV